MTEQEFEAIYEQTATPLRKYVARVLGNVRQADDIVQEAFLRALGTPPQTNDPQDFRRYVFRIASNILVDHWRQHKYESASAVLTERRTPARDAALPLDMERVFQQLQPRERQLLWLAHVEGADHRSIADTLGLSAGSIRVLLFRARQRFEKLLQEKGYGPGRKQ